MNVIKKRTELPRRSYHVVVEHPYGITRFGIGGVHRKCISITKKIAFKSQIIRFLTLNKPSIFSYPLFQPEKLIMSLNSNNSPAWRNSGTRVSSKQSWGILPMKTYKQKNHHCYTTFLISLLGVIHAVISELTGHKIALCVTSRDYRLRCLWDWE